MNIRTVVQYGKKSLAVIIPAEIVRYWGWRKGDAVKVNVTSMGMLVVAMPRDEQEGAHEVAGE